MNDMRNKTISSSQSVTQGYNNTMTRFNDGDTTSKTLLLVTWTFCQWQYPCEKIMNFGSRNATENHTELASLLLSRYGEDTRYLYWKRICIDIENMIKKCSICQENLPAPLKETLQPHNIPKQLWEVIGTDLFYFNDHEYLIIADSYSKFSIIHKRTRKSTSNMVISAIK